MGDRNNISNKKRFYKKWWFWVLIIILLYMIIGAVNGNEKDDSSNGDQNAELTKAPEVTAITEPTKTTEPTNNPDITESADNTQGDNTTDNEATTAPENIDLARNNSSTVLTVLNTGTFSVGTDVTKGRYIITGDGSGNLFIYDNTGMPYINEILGGGDLGVDSVTTDIADGDKIEISGINNVTFTPAETILQEDKLTTGNWVVGIDFRPGRYDCSSESGTGNFFVYDKSGWPVVNEILGGGDLGVDKITVNLEEGQVISISGIKVVEFTKK